MDHHGKSIFNIKVGVFSGSEFQKGSASLIQLTMPYKPLNMFSITVYSVDRQKSLPMATPGPKRQ
jgi:hypothetical protein